MVSGGCIGGIWMVSLNVCGVRNSDVSEGLSGCSSLAGWRIHTVLAQP